MKTNEELNALKEEIEALNAKLAELSEEELLQIAGGGNGSDLYSTVMAHLFDAFQVVKTNKNSYLITMITYLQMLCQKKDYAQIADTITELLPTGANENPDKAAYDSLKKAKEAIENSGILNA